MKKPKKYPSAWTHKDIKDGWYRELRVTADCPKGVPRPIGWEQRNIKKTVQSLLKTAEWAGSTVEVHSHQTTRTEEYWNKKGRKDYRISSRLHPACHVLKHPSGAELHLYGEAD